MFLLQGVLCVISEYHRYFLKQPGLECGIKLFLLKLSLDDLLWDELSLAVLCKLSMVELPWGDFHEVSCHGE